jgi:hypothetical protein
MTERFTLLSELGRGGMGVVWKARDEDSGQIVALKLLRETYAEDPDYVTRFERELELAKRIHSDHVVKVLGFGVRNKVPYLALEYVDGPSLHDALLSHGPYDWPEARALLIQIAQGLADAHAADIIHRDVKPSNVLMGADGVAKLTDFGIARGLDLTRVTATSTMLGTPAYLAPEGPVDTRSDLYSLGIIGYELLSGSPPFVGSTYQQIILAHVRTPPDLAKLPPDARSIVGWLLAKDADERPQNGQELLAVLRGRLMLPGSIAPSIAPAAPVAPTPPAPKMGSPAELPIAEPPSPAGALDQWAYYGGSGVGRGGQESPPNLRDVGRFVRRALVSAATLSATGTLRDVGRFFRGPTMNVPRTGHSSTLMADGRVLLMGGWLGNGVTGAAEAFEPVSGNISQAGTTLWARMDHTATLLLDGRVLVAGGRDDPITFASAEIYDPTSGSFSPVPSMKFARKAYAATRLLDGRVLIVGGISQDDSPVGVIEAFDPATGFSQVGELLSPRTGHAVTLLEDGRVLITGGWDGSTTGHLAGAAELYDPGTQVSVYVGRLTKPRRNHTSVLLPDGRVLIAGGYDETPVASVEIYAPRTVGFTAIAPFRKPRSDHTATVLPDGRVLIAGGLGPDGLSRSTELFRPDSNSFVLDAPLTVARQGHTATLLPNGQVFIAGGRGQSGGVLASTEVYSR